VEILSEREIGINGKIIFEPFTQTGFTMTKKPTHGGKRKGSGRPALGYKRVNVMLGDGHIDKATKIGDGNLSLGVRKAIETK